MPRSSDVGPTAPRLDVSAATGIGDGDRVFVSVRRLTLAPGARLEREVDGATIVEVVNGAVARTGDASETGDQTGELDVGDRLSARPGQRMSLTNRRDTPAVLIESVVTTAPLLPEPAGDQGDGIWVEELAIAEVVDVGPETVWVRSTRIELPGPDGAMLTDGLGSYGLVVVESGRIVVTAGSGSVAAWRLGSVTGDPVPAGTELVLHPGLAALVDAGTDIELRNPDQTDAVITVVEITTTVTITADG